MNITVRCINLLKNWSLCNNMNIEIVSYECRLIEQSLVSCTIPIKNFKFYFYIKIVIVKTDYEYLPSK